MRALSSLAVLVVTVGTPAWAQDVDRAKTAFERAERAYRVRDFASALAGYQEAYEAFPRPEFLFNIGQAQRGLQRWRAAIFSFEMYLRDAEAPSDRAEVEALIAVLDERAREEEAARATIRPPPPPVEEPDLLPSERVVVEDESVLDQWWFWTAAGAVVVAGVVTGVALASQDPPGPSGTLGQFDYR